MSFPQPLDVTLESFNNYSGFITALGLFFVIPFTILSDRLIKELSRRKMRRQLKHLLLHELWMNANYVSQIEQSYMNNLTDKGNLHIPHYPPRTNILGKFLEYEVVVSLTERERELFLELFEQLETLKHEYYWWRDLLSKSAIMDDETLYKAFSSTLISYIEPIMKNLLWLWIDLVRELGGKSEFAQIREVNALLTQRIREGKWIDVGYRASGCENYDQAGRKVDVFLCWNNDLKRPSKEVEILEIRNVAAMHGSWKRTSEASAVKNSPPN